MNSFGDSAPGHLTLAQLQAQQEQQAQGAPRQLAERAGQTSVDNPWPLHVLSNKMHEYIARCVPTWVEGQIIELNHRGRVSYVTLRDIEQEVSVSVTVGSRFGAQRWLRCRASWSGALGWFCSSSLISG